MTKKIHCEIEYVKEDGTSIHSDVCPPQCLFENIDQWYRDYLHALLDEWLDNAGGTGQFYIKAEGWGAFGDADIADAITNTEQNRKTVDFKGERQ